MIRTFNALIFFALTATAGAQTTYELTNMGTTFDPPVINMIAGDSIHLVLENPHTCTEVDQATWDAGDVTSNGGFDFPAGEHTFALDVPGTYYYVCIPHADMGMKGQFVVAINTGVQESAGNAAMQLFPNPASAQVTLSGIAAGQVLNILDVNGRIALTATTTADGPLDVSKLEVGTYMVTVKDAKGATISQERLVITR